MYPTSNNVFFLFISFRLLESAIVLFLVESLCALSYTIHELTISTHFVFVFCFVFCFAALLCASTFMCVHFTPVDPLIGANTLSYTPTISFVSTYCLHYYCVLYFTAKETKTKKNSFFPIVSTQLRAYTQTLTWTDWKERTRWTEKQLRHFNSRWYQ